jgi:hypothetical protein
VIDPKWRSYTNMMDSMWQRMGLAGADVTEERMINGMDRYHEEVRQTVPAERLLVWSVTDGWEPLCEFLEAPVPDAPFPHLNDSKMFAERVIDGSLHILQEWRGETEDVARAATMSSGRDEPTVASTA